MPLVPMDKIQGICLKAGNYIAMGWKAQIKLTRGGEIRKFMEFLSCPYNWVIHSEIQIWIYNHFISFLEHRWFRWIIGTSSMDSSWIRFLRTKIRAESTAERIRHSGKNPMTQLVPQAWNITCRRQQLPSSPTPEEQATPQLHWPSLSPSNLHPRD